MNSSPGRQSSLVILKDNVAVPAELLPDDSPSSGGDEEALESGVVVLTTEELRQSSSLARMVHTFRSYEDVTLVTPKLGALRRPFVSATTVALLGRGTRRLMDEDGSATAVNLGLLVRWGARYVRDLVRMPSLLRSVRSDVAALRSGPHRVESHRGNGAESLDLSASPLYLRSDLWFGLRSGGSIGHTAGVVNNLGQFTGPPLFVGAAKVPTVSGDVEQHILDIDIGFWDIADASSLAANRAFIRQITRLCSGRTIGFVYHRNAPFSYAGLAVARRLGVPLVIEYSGSEVWVARNWGKRLHFEKEAIKIEQLNLTEAALVVAVSRPLFDELVERGVAADRILINSNGVDPAIYSPSVDGSVVRSRYGLDNKLVIGFIGTFGRWHGAEELTRAFALLLRSRPDLRRTARLLLIGDGVTMAEVKTAITQSGVAPETILTGLVPQAEGAAHLAACDVLVAPHVPNADGSPFFGSPTKLFEYMATGRAIVASNLGEIGEVLEDRKTALLVAPGDIEALAAAIECVIDDPELRDRLARAARDEVVAHHTWQFHTRRIVAALEGRAG